MGRLICKRENKFVIEYCLDDKSAVREYEFNIRKYRRVCYNTD